MARQPERRPTRTTAHEMRAIFFFRTKSAIRCYRLETFPLFSALILRPVAVVHIGENIVQSLNAAKISFIYRAGGELFVKGNEANQMIFDAFAGVVRARAGAENKWPVARLGQEQFARGLLEGAFG